MASSIIRVRLDLSDFKDDVYKFQWTSFTLGQFVVVQSLIEDLVKKFDLSNNVLLYLNEYPYILPPSQSASIIQNGDLLIIKKRDLKPTPPPTSASSRTSTKNKSFKSKSTSRESLSSNDSSIIPPEGVLCRINGRKGVCTSSSESEDQEKNTSKKTSISNGSRPKIPNKESTPLEEGLVQIVNEESSDSSDSVHQKKQKSNENSKNKTSSLSEKNPTSSKAVIVESSSSSSSDSSDSDNKKKRKIDENSSTKNKASFSENTLTSSKTLVVKDSSSSSSSSSDSSDSDNKKKRKLDENISTKSRASFNENIPSSSKPVLIKDTSSDDDSPDSDKKAKTAHETFTNKQSTPFQNGTSSRKKRKRRRKKRNRNALPNPLTESMLSTPTPQTLETPNVSLSRNGPDITCESVMLVEHHEADQENVSKLGLDQLVNGGQLHVGKRRNNHLDGKAVSPKNNFEDLKSPPKPGDVIIFKVLELSETYNPVISHFKKGKVLSFDGVNIRLDILDKESQSHNGRNLGKFDLGDEVNHHASSSPDSTYLWKDLIDVKAVVGGHHHG